MKLLLILALLLPLTALAQYSGPAVETCRSYAEAQQKKSGHKPAAVVLHADRALGIDRHTQRVGSQAVSSILYGNGAIVTPSGAGTAMSFVCLLADDKRAVFFYWAPRLDAPALEVCTREVPTCLDSLYFVVEADLTQAYALRYQEANEADLKAGNKVAGDAFRRSNQAWIAYRDAECARRGTGNINKACIVDITRRRLADVR